MAEQDSATNGNGSGELNAPQAATLVQYVKDMSVECPNSPQVFQWNEQPRVDVQFGINANRISDDVHEVVIKLDVSARSDSGVQFLIDLSYAGLFGLRNIPEEAMGAFLLVEAPRLLFPFARQIVADATHQTGFPPLLLDPVDFAATYMAQMEAQQGQPDPGGNGSGGGGGEGSEPPSGAIGQA